MNLSYKRSKYPSPQASVIAPISQPDRVSYELQDLPPADNSVLHLPKESDSESKPDSWSFDKAINEVFRLLLEEMCPKMSKDLSF